MKSPVITAIILAGGKSEAALAEYNGTPHRALAKLNGVSLIQKVLSAVEGVNSTISNIYIIGDLPTFENCVSLPDRGDFVSNLLNGLQQCTPESYALILTADIPFITAESLNLFLKESVKLCEDGVSMIWPVIPVDQCYSSYPGISRTALNLKEGKLTGGNLALVNPTALLNQRDKIASAYKSRKSIFKLAMLLGPATLIRFAMSMLRVKGALTVPYLERCVSKLIGSKAGALLCNCPDLATDLDKVSDFEAAEKFVSCST